jgi:Holliday junction resolvasome RuvABC endonuclease subunit
MKLYIGLDQALANTGWVVGEVNNKEIALIDAGCLVTKAEEDLMDRLLKIDGLVSSLLETYRPERVYTESVFMPFNRKGIAAIRALLKVEAVVHLSLTKHKCAYSVMCSDPKVETSWRAVLNVNKGVKGKELPFVKDKGLTINEHTADAIGILLGGVVVENIVNLESALNFVNNIPSVVKIKKSKTGKKEDGLTRRVRDRGIRQEARV